MQRAFSSLWKVCVSIHDEWYWGLTNVQHEGKHNLVSQSPATSQGEDVLYSESLSWADSKDAGLLWFNFMISYASSPTLLSYCDWRSQVFWSRRYFVEKNGVVLQIKKHCCLGKKPQKTAKKLWEKCNYFGTTWFLVSQNKRKLRRAALKRSTVRVLQQGVWHNLWPPAHYFVFTHLVSFFGTYRPVLSMNSCIHLNHLAIS